MNLPPLSIGIVHICFKGCLVLFFIFIQILMEQGWVSSAVSSLGLRCLPTSHKKDARLIYAKLVLLQSVKTQMKCCKIQHFIMVCTIC